MYALDDAGILEIMYGFPGFLPVLIGENKLGLTGAFDFHFHVFIYIAVGMAGDGDGFSQFLTQGSIPFTTMGALNTVPSRMERMVPLGLFHISFSLYSSIRAALGVIVAHFTATPYFLWLRRNLR